jgi:MoxR-like ATPase
MFQSAPRLIPARFPGVCWTCSGAFEEGAPIWFHANAYVDSRAPDSKPQSPVWHKACSRPEPYVPPATQAPAPAYTQDYSAPPPAPERVPASPADPFDVIVRAVEARMRPQVPALDEGRVRALALEVVGGYSVKAGDDIATRAKRAAAEGTREAIEAALADGKEVDALEHLPQVPAVDPLYEDSGEASGAVRAMLATNRPFECNGPSGSGKTFPIRQECAKAGRALLELVCGDGIGYSQLIGSSCFEYDKDGKQRIGFRFGVVPRGMLAGCPVLLDELDQTPRTVASLLYGVTEPGKPATLDIGELGRTIVAKPGFVLCGTSNTVRDETGGYSGERPSFALLNRLAHVPCDYLPEKVEVAILRKVGLAEKPALACVRALQALRKEHDKGSLLVAPGTRTGVQVARLTLGLLPDGSKPAGVQVVLSPNSAWVLYVLGALPKQQSDTAALAIRAAYTAVGVPLT